MFKEVAMLIDQVASRLKTAPEELERASLRLYVAHQLRVVESELFSLAHRYGVQTVFELDEAVRAGKFSETEAFGDYFRLDHLESERDKLRELLTQL
jgi:hypothetical protein